MGGLEPLSPVRDRPFLLGSVILFPLNFLPPQPPCGRSPPVVFLVVFYFPQCGGWFRFASSRRFGDITKSLNPSCDFFFPPPSPHSPVTASSLFTRDPSPPPGFVLGRQVLALFFVPDPGCRKFLNPLFANSGSLFGGIALSHGKGPLTLSGTYSLSFSSLPRGIFCQARATFRSEVFSGLVLLAHRRPPPFRLAFSVAPIWPAAPALGSSLTAGRLLLWRGEFAHA